jgi:hypothetical protein
MTSQRRKKNTIAEREQHFPMTFESLNKNEMRKIQKEYDAVKNSYL